MASRIRSSSSSSSSSSAIAASAGESRVADPHLRSGAASRAVRGLLVAGAAALAIACGDDGGSSSAPTSLQGTYANDVPGPVVSAGRAQPAIAVPDDCELDLDAFAFVQSGTQGVILYGIGGAGGGVIPGFFGEGDDSDRFEIDYEVENAGAGNTTHIQGELGTSLVDATFDGTIQMEIIGGSIQDCGPTSFVISASRDTTSLPAPSSVFDSGGANGDWSLDLDEAETTCGPVIPSLRTWDVAVVTDPGASSAEVTVDDGGDLRTLDAALVDRFIVAKWKVDVTEDETERHLTAVRYLPSPISQDFLIGADTIVVSDPEGSCQAIDELLGTRPPVL